MRLRNQRKRISSSTFSNFFTCGSNSNESHALDSAVRRRTSSIEENTLEMSAETGNHSSSLDETIPSVSDNSLQIFSEQFPHSSGEMSSTPSITNSTSSPAENQIPVDTSATSNLQVSEIQFLTDGSFFMNHPSPPRSITRSISRTFRFPHFLSTSFSRNRTRTTLNTVTETNSRNNNNRGRNKKCEGKKFFCIYLGYCYCNADSKEAYFEEIFDDSIKIPENSNYQYDFLYSCVYCRANLAIHSALISRSFQGSQGRAYLFDTVVNVREKKAEQRLLLTGLHDVADIFCKCCHTMVGWKYERAYEMSQKYKEGRFIIEQAHIVKTSNWII